MHSKPKTLQQFIARGKDYAQDQSAAVIDATAALV
jgi:hypothetical protein